MHQQLQPTSGAEWRWRNDSLQGTAIIQTANKIGDKNLGACITPKRVLSWISDLHRESWWWRYRRRTWGYSCPEFGKENYHVDDMGSRLACLFSTGQGSLGPWGFNASQFSFIGLSISATNCPMFSFALLTPGLWLCLLVQFSFLLAEVAVYAFRRLFPAVSPVLHFGSHMVGL